MTGVGELCPRSPPVGANGRQAEEMFRGRCPF